MKRLFWVMILLTGVSSAQVIVGGGNGGGGCRDNCGTDPGTGGDNNPPPVSQTLVESTRRPQLTRLGCFDCDREGIDIVPVLSGYYNGVAVMLGVGPQQGDPGSVQNQPDTAAVAIAPAARAASAASAPLPAAGEINILLGDTQPFARPGIVKSIRRW